MHYQPLSACRGASLLTHRLPYRGLSYAGLQRPSHCSGATPWRRPDRIFRDLSVPEGGKYSLVLVYMTVSRPRTLGRVLTTEHHHLIVDQQNGSQVFEGQHQGREAWERDNQDPNPRTPPNGQFPMHNGGHVKFEVPKVPVIFVLGE
uniref:Uncharacterized protein n=1 Tax=Timema douglasi TaxID=61478 RepID=A0A7R8VTZ7_TIMDO|nr:unnamed protein product [Timema douglasi]